MELDVIPFLSFDFEIWSHRKLQSKYKDILRILCPVFPVTISNHRIGYKVSFCVSVSHVNAHKATSTIKMQTTSSSYCSPLSCPSIATCTAPFTPFLNLLSICNFVILRRFCTWNHILCDLWDQLNVWDISILSTNDTFVCIAK